MSEGNVVYKEALVAFFCRQERAFMAFGNEEAAEIARNWAALFLEGPIAMTSFDVKALEASFAEKYIDPNAERKWHHGVMAGVILLNALAQYAMM